MLPERDTPFTFKARLASVRHALDGLATLLRDQHNARIHAVVAVMVIALGWGLQISRIEWLLLILTIGWVFSMEAVNSALEYLGDAVSRERHPLLGKAKDVAAAAVLISAVVAVLVGLFIFGPPLLGFVGMNQAGTN